MSASTKRMRSIREQLEPGKVYGVEEAFALLKSMSKLKFTESVDVAVKLGVDSRKSDQNVRGSTVLPNGTGKTVRVAVFAQGDNADKARAAGADVVGMDDLHDLIKGGDLDFGVVIATPSYHGGISGLVKNAIDFVEDMRDDERPYLDGRAVGCIVVADGPQAIGATRLPER